MAYATRLLCLPHLFLLAKRSSATSKPTKWREWRMEVPSLAESASIRPLNPPHRSFLLRLDVLHLCCCAPAFHDLSEAADEGDEGRLQASARLVRLLSTWARLDRPPPAWARLVEDSSDWALPVRTPPDCSPLPLALLVLRVQPPTWAPLPPYLLVAWAKILWPRGFVRF
jgi:hypothetical protein